MRGLGERPRVVFDCNTIVQAVANDEGPSAETLRYLDRGIIDVYLSRPVLREFRAVLNYPAVRRKLPQIEDALVDALIKRLTFRGILLRRVPHIFEYPRAKQDEPYVDLAAVSKSDFLVSNGTDLLALMTGHSAVSKRFRQITRPLQVIAPVDFLRVLRQLGKLA